MPGIGGRFGWNEPPPAAITTTLASNTSFSSVVTRKRAVLELLQAGDHAVEGEFRLERRDLLHQLVDQALAPRSIGQAGMS